MSFIRASEVSSARSLPLPIPILGDLTFSEDEDNLLDFDFDNYELDEDDLMEFELPSRERRVTFSSELDNEELNRAIKQCKDGLHPDHIDADKGYQSKTIASFKCCMLGLSSSSSSVLGGALYSFSFSLFLAGVGQSGNKLDTSFSFGWMRRATIKAILALAMGFL